MNDHVLERLEFPKVLQLLAARAASPMGRQEAFALRPYADRRRAESELRRVLELRDAMIADLDPGPVELGNVDRLLPRLAREGDLFEPSELLDLGRLLSLSTRVRQLLDRPAVADGYPFLHALALRFSDFGAIVRRMEEVFDPSGEMLDTASARLGRLRKKLRETRADAGRELSELARKGTDPEEGFVTIRDGRYVLAVRTQDRSRMPGIVHGRSKTGQTLFLEPLPIVERNNAIASIEADEAEERIAILRDLCKTVAARAEEIREASAAAVDLDLLRARARLCLDLAAMGPTFNDGSTLRLVAGRHPLLVEAERNGGTRVVPLDLEIEEGARTLVLSGPNMGGKTVVLKTLGLLCSMAQAGLPIPAREGTDLPFLDQIFADLGDEQSIEQETSTFAGHLRNIGSAWRGATDQSLVLLDELGGGTDPEEGIAIGRALVELLTDRACMLVVTTHLVGLKLVAQEHPGMRNASMEFDSATERPTYRLRMGTPGRSRAFELARRVLPHGELIDRAEGYRTRWVAQLDDLLGEMEKERAALADERLRLQETRRDLQEATETKLRQVSKLQSRLHAIREARWEREGHALAEAARLLAEAKRIRAEAERRSREGREVREDLESIAEGIDKAARSRRRPRGATRPRLPLEEMREGAQAWSDDLRAVVRIDSPPDATGKVWVQHGALRLRVPAASLSVRGASDADREPLRRPPLRGPETPVEIPREIDIRGLTAEEGRRAIEAWIDRAAIAGMHEVRIVHGKGTGRLKRSIETFLSENPLVESYRTGEPREGGWGATIVAIRSARLED